jgi:membrane associated rhomboid family serine protease
MVGQAPVRLSQQAHRLADARRAFSRAWPALCLLLIAGAALAWVACAQGWVTADALMWRRGPPGSPPWTWWTAPLLHPDAAHWVGNALALGALAVLGVALHATRADALALALAWPLGTLALLAWPAIGGYYGLSGTVHAAAAILALRAWRAPATRPLGLLLAGGLLIKLALERGWAMPVGFDHGWGFNVVYAAHFSGAAVGAAVAISAAWLRHLSWQCQINRNSVSN